MKYVVAILLFLIWALWIFLGPETAVKLVNAGLAGWFVGTKIGDFSTYISEREWK